MSPGDHNAGLFPLHYYDVLFHSDGFNYYTCCASTSLAALGNNPQSFENIFPRNILYIQDAYHPITV